MAYITTERIAEIRKEIKATFPGWKFSITRRHYSTVVIAIMSAPIDLIEGEQLAQYADGRTPTKYHDVNVHWIEDNYKDNPLKAQILSKIHSIANVGNFDNSDAQTDYFHVGFYVDISIGKWDADFVFTPNKGVIPELESKKENEYVIGEFDEMGNQTGTPHYTSANIIPFPVIRVGQVFPTNNCGFRVKAVHA